MITSVYMCRQTDIHECVVCVDVVKWWTVVSDWWWRLGAAAHYYFKNQYYLLAMATDCLNKNKCVAHRCLGLFEHCVLVFRHIFLSSILDSFSFFPLSITINFVAVFIILPLNIKHFCSQKLVPLWLKRYVTGSRQSKLLIWNCAWFNDRIITPVNIPICRTPFSRIIYFREMINTEIAGNECSRI